jgi:hypothetical protein
MRSGQKRSVETERLLADKRWGNTAVGGCLGSLDESCLGPVTWRVDWGWKRTAKVEILMKQVTRSRTGRGKARLDQQ